MKDDIEKAIRSILLEFQQRDFPEPISRDVFLPQSKTLKKAWVLIGMRRSGKTWTVYQQIRKRLDQGFKKNTNLYINFEDDRLYGFKINHFQIILDIYFELFPMNIDKKDLFFCFDEIHVVPGWEKFIRRLIDTEDMQICITGSSAEMLSKELATTLAGRAWTQEVFPFSFVEYLKFFKIEKNQNRTSKIESKIKFLANEYLLYGGFPEVVLESKELHTSLIQGYRKPPRKPRMLASGMNWRNNFKKHFTNSKHDSILYM